MQWRLTLEFVEHARLGDTVLLRTTRVLESFLRGVQQISGKALP